MDLGELHLKFIENWDSFKQTLGQGVDLARGIGISEDNIEHAAKNVGDFLNKHVDPENPQQRTLKELWDSSSDEDRQHLAKSVINMVDNRKRD